jgi:hypothetical protein
MNLISHFVTQAVTPYTFAVNDDRPSRPYKPRPRKANGTFEKVPEVEIEYKLCSKCKKVHPVSEFNKHIRMSDGYQSYCKPCHAIAIKEYKAKKLKEKPMEVFDNVRNWAGDRNIILGSTVQAQFVKLMEEVGELANGISKGRPDEIIDGIGDSMVVLTIIAEQFGFKAEECLESAYQQIKDRRGKIINGTYVKESDLG